MWFFNGWEIMDKFHLIFAKYYLRRRCSNREIGGFQEYNREMLEENYLKPMNLPTKTENDEINKELYFLKKTVKELTNQIKELKEKK